MRARGEPSQPPAQGPAGRPTGRTGPEQVGQPPAGQSEQQPPRGGRGGPGVRGPGSQPPQQAGQQVGQATTGRPAGPASQGQPGAPGPTGLEPVGLAELMRTEVVTAQRDTPVATVVAEMAEKNVGSVVIVEDHSPVGVVTDRGIALALETTPDVAEHEVDELIAEDLVTGSTEMSVPGALDRLSEAGVRRLPIVDGDGALAGIVTVDDVLLLYSEGLSDVAGIVRDQSPQL